MTSVRVWSSSSTRDDRQRSCERLSWMGTSSTVAIERVGPTAASITLRHGSDLDSCDEIPNRLKDRNSQLADTPWCGGAVGRLRDGALRDARLVLCWPADGGPLTAFAWINPRPGVRWIVIRDGETRHVYEVAAGLPVRVARKLKATVAESASFDVEEYASDGTRLRSYTLDTKVAG